MRFTAAKWREDAQPHPMLALLAGIAQRCYRRSAAPGEGFQKRIDYLGRLLTPCARPYGRLIGFYYQLPQRSCAGLKGV
eukprot:COSAG04_NODE_84_length_27625_cov_23.289835_13_plen_79_part_00